jgi:MPBQ/MSBQ methyltransferase
MNTETIAAKPASTVNPDFSSRDQIRENVLAYYTAATADYKVWSSGFNMHFGYWRWGLNPFRREAMLREMNVQTLKRLNIPSERPARLVDLGGGTGATAREAVASYPNLEVDVVTLVPKQIEIGSALNAAAVRGHQISMHCADYLATHLPDGHYDAVCMIESACHAPGMTKDALLKEAYRLLKPGGYFIMVDAMLLREIPKRGIFSRTLAAIYRRWCTAWAVSEMARQDLLPAAMEANGFREIKLENWSWNVTPSVAHIPLFASYFAIAELIKARGMLPLWRWRHIVASLLTPLLGLCRSSFTYGAVIARRPENNN